MSNETGLLLALVTLASIFASYRIGYTAGENNILNEYERYARRRRERERRWQEFEIDEEE